MNESPTLKHEFMLSPWLDSGAALPYDQKTQQVNESLLSELQWTTSIPGKRSRLAWCSNQVDISLSVMSPDTFVMSCVPHLL